MSPNPTKPSHEEIVEELNHLMAEEVEAFLRYFQLRHRVDEKSSFFPEAMKETIEHAEEIATHIRALGHIPKLNIKLAVHGGPLSLKDALSEALMFEQQALDAYKDLLPSVKGDGPLEEFIRRQIATEGEHVAEITNLLR